MVIDRIMKVLEEKGYTAKQLSQGTGISTGNISDWKSGRAQPSYGAIVKIAQYLDVSINYLHGTTNDPSIFLVGALNSVGMNKIKNAIDRTTIKNDISNLHPDAMDVYVEVFEEFLDKNAQYIMSETLIRMQEKDDE